MGEEVVLPPTVDGRKRRANGVSVDAEWRVSARTGKRYKMPPLEARIRYRQTYYLKNVERFKERDRLRNYGHCGYRRGDYGRILAAQGGVCAICGASPGERGERGLHLDHDHAHNVIRGILCHSCNTGLGAWEEDVDRFYRAINYLMAHRSIRRGVEFHGMAAD